MTDRVERKYRDMEGITGANSNNAPRRARNIRDNNGLGAGYRHHLCCDWSSVDAGFRGFSRVSGSSDGLFGCLGIAESHFRSDGPPALDLPMPLM
jgi:hypothetical protein